MYLTQLLDTIFPPSEDARVVRKLNDTTIHKLFSYQRVDGVIVLSQYSDPNVRALIHEAKFCNNTHACELLGILFSKYISIVTIPIDVIIPIPLSSKRLRERGYNQVLRALSKVDIPASMHIRTDFITRKRNTRPQTELGRGERLKNMHGAFSAMHEEHITGKHLMLIDDVMTTGATLRAAKASLLPHSPSSITCVAFAH